MSRVYLFSFLLLCSSSSSSSLSRITVKEQLRPVLFEKPLGCVDLETLFRKTHALRPTINTPWSSVSLELPLPVSGPLLTESACCFGSCDSLGLPSPPAILHDPRPPRKKPIPLGRAPSNTPPRVALATNACVSGYGYIILENIVFIPEEVCEVGMPRPYSSSSQMVGSVVVVSQVWGEGYFHFLFESVARLALVAPWLRGNPDVYVGLVNTNPPFVVEILEGMGIRKERLVATPLCASRVLLPEPVSCFQPSPHHLAALRRELLRALDLTAAATTTTTTTTTTSTRRPSILMVRRDNIRRRIANFPGLLDAVHALGVPIEVQADATNALMALAMWRKATLVLAPHGAALSNMVVLNPGSTIIEFQDSEEVNPAFERAARSLGLHYHVFFPPGAVHDATMTVDIARAVDLVRTILFHN